MAETTRRTSARRKTDDPAASEAPGEPAAATKPAASELPDDDRIGTACPESWATVTYDDGRQYRCEDGRHVERTR